jgi:hypothetical protein
MPVRATAEGIVPSLILDVDDPEVYRVPGFGHTVRAWARDSEYVYLTDEQYGKLTKH